MQRCEVWENTTLTCLGKNWSRETSYSHKTKHGVKYVKSWIGLLFEIAKTNFREYKKPNFTNIPLESIQYAAGFSDTDGCFQVSRQRLKFYIAQAERGIEALHFMYDTFGGIVVLHKIGNENHQTSYDWILYKEDASEYASLILQYLLIKKREAIVFINNALSLSDKDNKLQIHLNDECTHRLVECKYLCLEKNLHAFEKFNKRIDL